MFHALRLLAVLGFLASSAADADATVWLHTKGEDNPFAGGVQHIAVGAKDNGYSLGFRCSSASDLALVLLVPERPEASHLEFIRTLSIGLHVIIDDASPDVFDASIDVVPDGSRYIAVSEDPSVGALLHDVANAKRRVAIAAKFNEQVIWTSVFTVRGSRRAIEPLISNCRLPEQD